MEDVWPVYRAVLNSDAFAARIAVAEATLWDCHLCGNHCGLDRTQRAGPCGIGATMSVASYGPHHGEELPLRGWRGSGTIFFSGCNLHCVYCQNADISQQVTGRPVSPEALAHIMLELQARGCHNINLVSPTHIAAHIVPALALAAQAGLCIPIVYNTGGYDAPQALALMAGLVDIYMPDMKYSDSAVAERLSGVRDYVAVNRAATREMHRQVGDLQLDARGLARRGLLVRHLVLPGDLAGTADVVRFLAAEISRETYINVMAQYRPAYRARMCGESLLGHSLTSQEYQAAATQTRAVGLHRLDM